jgi:hypothetical protein
LARSDCGGCCVGGLFCCQADRTSRPARYETGRESGAWGADIGKQISSSIASVRTTLDGISDVASAQAALPKLQEVTAQIVKTGGEVGQLTAEQRKASGDQPADAGCQSSVR